MRLHAAVVELVAMAEAGEEVVLARSGKPVAGSCPGALALPVRLDQLGPTVPCGSGRSSDGRPDNPIDWFKQLFSLHDEASFTHG